MRDASEKNSYTLSAYRHFSAAQWANLRADTPNLLSESELSELRGRGEVTPLDEISQIYLPLSRLLNLYVSATQDLHRATSAFLGQLQPKVPYIIGLAGSVAVGKSTTARIIQALLARWPNHPKVDLITTDGFLYSNAALEEHGLSDRKGFPESFDSHALIAFLGAVKSGEAEVAAPVYSHETYDILTGQHIVVDQPDILIVEGLNVLQVPVLKAEGIMSPAISDFFDFSIYLDADTKHIKQWFLSRLLNLRATAFTKPDAYFHGLAQLDEEAVIDFGSDVWTRVNEKNLLQNILPTRERAQLILHKGSDHSISDVYLRKL